MTAKDARAVDRRSALIRVIRVIHVLLACLPLVACSHDPEVLGAPGEPCRSLMTSCVDDERVLRCEEEVWAEVECAMACASLAPGVESQGCQEDACACVPPAGGCSPGEAACGDTDLLRWCSDAWTWTETACVAVCGQMSPQTVSLGCHEADVDEDDATAHCLCTSEGAPCLEGAPSFCATGDALAVCTAGVWTYASCDESCGGGGSCDPGGEPSPACDCPG